MRAGNVCGDRRRSSRRCGSGLALVTGAVALGSLLLASCGTAPHEPEAEGAAAQPPAEPAAREAAAVAKQVVPREEAVAGKEAVPSKVTAPPEISRPIPAPAPTTFKPIFDGKTLAGWKAPDMSYWSVETDEDGDGAITGLGTAEHPVKKNQFLAWQLGELDDFELTLKYRLGGSRGANSGVQIRSRIQPDGHAVGYQADLDLGGRWTGALYDEHGRGMLAARGQRTEIAADGKRTRTSIGDAKALWAGIDTKGWNEYHITARGSRLTLRINGKIASEVIDEEKAHRDLSGRLALQLHSGPPLTVQFKDIRLRRLKMEDRKKIVLVAGPRSHGYGSHEHNAGNALLAKLLNENVPGVHAATYRDGWPKDPTAFDNADAISVFCDGGGRHPVIPHLDEVDALARKGVGIAMLHYGVEVPKGRAGDLFLEWIGGYYEAWWSVNPHWEAEFKTLPEHPVTRGVKPFKIDDEWYYHMRLTGGDGHEPGEGVTSILAAVPPDSTRTRKDGSHSGNEHVRARKGMPEHVAWAREREDGGRGFGFTGGHWQWSWAHDDFRKLVLNALVWIAGAEVPPGGVPSRTPTLDELLEGLDGQKPGNFRPEKVREMLEGWR